MLRRVGGYLLPRKATAPRASHKLEREGYALIRRAFSPRAIAPLRNEIVELYASLPDDGRARLDDSHFRYENFIVPNRKKLYIAIENQLSGQLGWLHLQIIDHSEIQLYGYALQKLL